MPNIPFKKLINLREDNYKEFLNMRNFLVLQMPWQNTFEWTTRTPSVSYPLPITLVDIASYLKTKGKPGLFESFKEHQTTLPKTEFTVEESLNIAILLDDEALFQQHVNNIPQQNVETYFKQAIGYVAGNCLKCLLMHMSLEFFERIVKELIEFLDDNKHLSPAQRNAIAPIYETLFARSDLFEKFKTEVGNGAAEETANFNIGVEFVIYACHNIDITRAKEFIAFIINLLPVTQLPKFYLRCVNDADKKALAKILEYVVKIIIDRLKTLPPAECSATILDTLASSISSGGESWNEPGIRAYLHAFKNDCNISIEFFIKILSHSQTAAALIRENMIDLKAVIAYRDQVNHSNILHIIFSHHYNLDSTHFLLKALLSADLLFETNTFGYCPLDFFVLFPPPHSRMVKPKILDVIKATLISNTEQWHAYLNRGLVINSKNVPVIPPRLIRSIFHNNQGLKLVFSDKIPEKTDIIALAQAFLHKLSELSVIGGWQIDIGTADKKVHIDKASLEQLAKISTAASAADGSQTPTLPQPTPAFISPPPPMRADSGEILEKWCGPLLRVPFKDILEKWYGPLIEGDIKIFHQFNNAKKLLPLIVHSVDDLIRQWLGSELTEEDIKFIKEKLTIVVRNSRHQGVYAYTHGNGTQLPQYPPAWKGRLKQCLQLTLTQCFAWALTGIIFHKITVATEHQTGQFIVPREHHYKNLSFELALQIHSFEDLLLQSRIIKLIESSARLPLSLLTIKTIFPLLNDAAITLSQTTKKAYQHYILNNRPLLPVTLLETQEEYHSLVASAQSLQLSVAQTSTTACVLTLNNTDLVRSTAVFNLIYLTYLYQRLINSGRQAAILTAPNFKDKNKPTTEEIKRLNNYSFIQQMFSMFCCSLSVSPQGIEDFLNEYATTILRHSQELIIILSEPSFIFSKAEIPLVLDVLHKVSLYLQTLNLDELFSVTQQDDAMDLDEALPNPDTMTTHALAEYVFNRGDGFLLRVLVSKKGQGPSDRVTEEFSALEKSHIRPATLVVKDLPTKLYSGGSGLIFGPVSLQQQEWPKYVVTAFPHNALSNHLKTLNPKGDLPADELVKKLEQSSQLRSFSSPIEFVRKLKHRYAKKNGEFPNISLNKFFMHFVDWCKIQYIADISHDQLSQYCHDLNCQMTERLHNVFQELINRAASIAIEDFESAIAKRSDPEKDPAKKSWQPQLPTDRVPLIDHSEIILQGLELLPPRELDPDADGDPDPYRKKLKLHCGDVLGINIDDGVDLIALAAWTKMLGVRKPEDIIFTYYSHQTGKVKVLPLESQAALITLLGLQFEFVNQQPPRPATSQPPLPSPPAPLPSPPPSASSPPPQPSISLAPPRATPSAPMLGFAPMPTSPQLSPSISVPQAQISAPSAAPSSSLFGAHPRPHTATPTPTINTTQPQSEKQDKKQPDRHNLRFLNQKEAPEKDTQGKKRRTPEDKSDSTFEDDATPHIKKRLKK